MLSATQNIVFSIEIFSEIEKKRYSTFEKRNFFQHDITSNGPQLANKNGLLYFDLY